MIPIKTPEEIEIMAEGGKILATILKEITEHVKTGVKTSELEKLTCNLIRKKQAIPSFLNYRPGPQRYGYPACLCVSVNEEIVHGLPRERALKNGDIVSLDVGIFYKGFHTDAAVTVAIGEVDDRVKKLISVTKKALEAGIAKMRQGNRIGDISFGIQEIIEKNGFAVVKDCTGHGIGRELHEEPNVPNFGLPHTGIVLKEGMVFALEPMALLKGSKIKVLKDSWTISAEKGDFAVHFEHTVAVTKTGPRILTKD